jgi:hypothetical protein
VGSPLGKNTNFHTSEYLMSQGQRFKEQQNKKLKDKKRESALHFVKGREVIYCVLALDGVSVASG